MGLTGGVKSHRYQGLGNSSIKKENDNNQLNQEYEPLNMKLLKAKKVSALVYKTLVRNKREIPSNSQTEEMASGLRLSLQSKSRLELGIPLGVAVYQKHKANRISI